MVEGSKLNDNFKTNSIIIEDNGQRDLWSYVMSIENSLKFVDVIPILAMFQ